MKHFVDMVSVCILLINRYVLCLAAFAILLSKISVFPSGREFTGICHKVGITHGIKVWSKYTGRS